MGFEVESTLFEGARELGRRTFHAHNQQAMASLKQPCEDTRLLTDLGSDELSAIALGLGMRMYGEWWGTSTTHDEGVDITAGGTLKYNGMVIARKATVGQLYHLMAAVQQK